MEKQSCNTKTKSTRPKITSYTIDISKLKGESNLNCQDVRQLMKIFKHAKQSNPFAPPRETLPNNTLSEDREYVDINKCSIIETPVTEQIQNLNAHKTTLPWMMRR